MNIDFIVKNFLLNNYFNQNKNLICFLFNLIIKFKIKEIIKIKIFKFFFFFFDLNV
jgi:hypothetical protein